MISISQFRSEIVLIPSIDAHKEKKWPPWAPALVFKVLPLLLREINSLQYPVKVLRSYRKAVRVKQFHKAPVYRRAKRAL